MFLICAVGLRELRDSAQHHARYRDHNLFPLTKEIVALVDPIVALLFPLEIWPCELLYDPSRPEYNNESFLQWVSQQREPWLCQSFHLEIDRRYQIGTSLHLTMVSQFS